MYFVCRWRDDHPLSKTVVKTADRTVLDFFRRGWDEEEYEDWVDEELDGGAYGLESIFEARREHDLPRPRTVEELRVLLLEHLWVEGDDTYIRLDEHSLRVRTDDDEVDLAYYFFDDVAVASMPERLTYMLHQDWPLPADAVADGSGFRHDVRVRTVDLGGHWQESTYAIHLAWWPPDMYSNLELSGAIEFAGLTLPDVEARLREAEASSDWPHDVQLLREILGEGRYPRKPKTRVQRDDHILQIAEFVDDFVCYDQWFVFDTRWAAANPALARSLLRYAAHWDPLDGVEGP
jgi:hypothetical protein